MNRTGYKTLRDLQGSSAARPSRLPTRLPDRRGRSSTSPSRSESLSARPDEVTSRADANSSSRLQAGCFPRAAGVRTTLVRQLRVCPSRSLESSFPFRSQFPAKDHDIGQPDAALGDVVEGDGLCGFVRKTISRAVVSVSTTICIRRRVVAEHACTLLPVHAPYGQPSRDARARPGCR